MKSLDSDGGIGRGEGGLTEEVTHTWALGEGQCPHRWRMGGKWHTGEIQTAESRLTSSSRLWDCVHQNRVGAGAKEGPRVPAARGWFAVWETPGNLKQEVCDRT